MSSLQPRPNRSSSTVFTGSRQPRFASHHTSVSPVLLTDCLVSLSRENCLMSLLGLQWHQKCHAMCSDSPPLSGSSQVACLGRGQTAHPQAGWPGSHFALTNSAPFAPSWVEPLLFPFTFPLTLLLFQLCKLPSISHFKI